MFSRTCLALLATTVLATPAMARDKTLYLGVEAGVVWGTDTDIDAENLPVIPGGPSELDHFLEIGHNTGWEAGAIFGYDAGLVRAALDVSHAEIEGVRAEGKRTIWTLEAGKIGNEKPIVMTREVWSSPELLVTLRSRDSDPLMGDDSFRLQNVSRGEPDASLFRVPADYTKLASPAAGPRRRG